MVKSQTLGICMKHGMPSAICEPEFAPMVGFCLKNHLMISRQQQQLSPWPKTVDNLKYNSEAMKPMLAALAKFPQGGFPDINTLSEHIAKFFGAQGMTASPKVLSDQSWSFRYLLQVLKGLKKRNSPPKEPRLNPIFLFFWFSIP